jgi:hypothetical protein
MKPILALLFCLALCGQPCRAQDDEPETAVQTHTEPGLRIPTGAGHYMLGANLLLAEVRLQKGLDANYSLGLTPKAAVFVLPNIALGLNLSLEYQGNKTYNTLNYGISPFVRTYFRHDNGGQPDRPLQFFIEAGVGYGGSNTRNETSTGVEKVNSNGVRLYALPGVDYFFNAHTAFELGLEYLFIGAKPTTQVLGISLGLQVFL